MISQCYGLCSTAPCVVRWARALVGLMPQNLVTDLVISLDSQGAAFEAHGLISADGTPLLPTQVLPDRDTPIVVTEVTTTHVRFRNDGVEATATAIFRVMRIASVQAQSDLSTLRWRAGQPPATVFYLQPSAEFETGLVKTSMESALLAVEQARLVYPFGPFMIYVTEDCYDTHGPVDDLGFDGTGLTIAGLPSITQPYFETVGSFFVMDGKPPPTMKNLWWGHFNSAQPFLTVGANTYAWPMESVYATQTSTQPTVLINNAASDLIITLDKITYFARTGARRFFSFTAAGAVQTFLFNGSGADDQIATGAVGTWTMIISGTYSADSLIAQNDQSPTFTGTYPDPFDAASPHGVAAAVAP